MILNYLNSFLRFFRKHKVFTVINLLGLSIGFLSAILVFSYVRFQLSFDSFHNDADQLYRVHVGEGIQAPKVFPALSKALSSNLTEVQNSVRLKTAYGSIGTKVMAPRDKKIYWVDDSFFEIFSYKILEHASDAPLKRPFTAAISKSLAEDYFGVKSPIGETMMFIDLYNKESLFEITAVFEDVPENSHLTFDALLSYNSLEESSADYQYGWSWRGIYTYVKLMPTAKTEELSQACGALLKTFKSQPYNSIKEDELFKFVPVKEIHTLKNFPEDSEKYGNIESVYTLLIFSILLFAVSLFNYLNLTSVSAFFRYKEVGVKKILGAKNNQIALQFIAEAMIIFFVAFALAMIISMLLYPEILKFTAIQNPLHLLMDADSLIGVILFLFIGISSSGLYTYFTLNKVQPISVLKNVTNTTSKSIVTNTFMVFQFALSICLVICVLSINSQLNFMQKQNLGINLKDVVIIKQPQGGIRSFESTETFKNRIASFSTVSTISACDQIPGRNLSLSWWDLSCVDTQFTPTADVEYFIINTDKDFLPLFGISLLAGRNFAESDSDKIIINQLALKSLGFKEPTSAINQKIQLGESLFEIVGVVNNYHHKSLKENIVPLVIANSAELIPFFAIRIDKHDDLEVISGIKKEWESIYSGSIFDLIFLEDSFNQQYKDDSKFFRSILILSILVIAISCFGIVGVSIFTTEKRSKEIAIRKVLGSTTGSIHWLFFKSYVIQITVASLVALPTAYYFITSWINRYPFKVSLGSELFILPILLIMILSFFTVGVIILSMLRKLQLIDLTKDQ